MSEGIDTKSHLLYSSLPNIVIAFHGCDKKVFEKILHKHEPFKSSNNPYDWLGNGMYFWEQNLERAWEWAKFGVNNPKINIEEPAVIGAVIDLGYCLNLLDSNNIKMLKNEYTILEAEMRLAGKDMPVNKNLKGDNNLRLRYLDCAVIEHLHHERELNGVKPFDSVRGAFFEGDPIYPTAGFMEQSHIQICVRNPNCIKGFFAPREIKEDWSY